MPPALLTRLLEGGAASKFMAPPERAILEIRRFWVRMVSTETILAGRHVRTPRRRDSPREQEQLESARGAAVAPWPRMRSPVRQLAKMP